ncbi:hypothetical protein ACOSQ4_029638 [Xanthoceras sorbifolium]
MKFSIYNLLDQQKYISSPDLDSDFRNLHNRLVSYLKPYLLTTRAHHQHTLIYAAQVSIWIKVYIQILVDFNHPPWI